MKLREQLLGSKIEQIHHLRKITKGSLFACLLIPLIVFTIVNLQNVDISGEKARAKKKFDARMKGINK